MSPGKATNSYYGEHEHQLPDLDAYIEGHKCNRNLRLRQPDRGQCTGKPQPVQQTESKGYQPWIPVSETISIAATPGDFDR